MFSRFLATLCLLRAAELSMPLGFFARADCNAFTRLFSSTAILNSPVGETAYVGACPPSMYLPEITFTWQVSPV